MPRTPLYRICWIIATLLAACMLPGVLVGVQNTTHAHWTIIAGSTIVIAAIVVSLAFACDAWRRHHG